MLGGGISIIMVLIWPLLMLENVVQDLGNFSLQILMVHNLQIHKGNSDFNSKLNIYYLSPEGLGKGG